jgi:hypothetical protein
MPPSSLSGPRQRAIWLLLFSCCIGSGAWLRRAKEGTKPEAGQRHDPGDRKALDEARGSDERYVLPSARYTMVSLRRIGFIDSRKRNSSSCRCPRATRIVPCPSRCCVRAPSQLSRVVSRSLFRGTLVAAKQRCSEHPSAVPQEAVYLSPQSSAPPKGIRQNLLPAQPSPALCRVQHVHAPRTARSFWPYCGLTFEVLTAHAGAGVDAARG